MPNRIRIKDFLSSLLIFLIVVGTLSTALTSCCRKDGTCCCHFNLKPLCRCNHFCTPPKYVQEYPDVIDFMPSDYNEYTDDVPCLECEWFHESENCETCQGDSKEDEYNPQKMFREMKSGSYFTDEEEDDKTNIEELTNPNKPVIDKYLIAVGDVLEISVFGDEDTIVENTIVAPDGRIYYLFLDPVVAEGRTIEELRIELEERLSHMFLVPTVSIIPRVQSKNTVTVLGRVRKPGLYTLTQAVTIRQLLGYAGGLVIDPETLYGEGFGIGGLDGYSYRGGYRGGYFATRGNNRNIPSLKDSFLVRQGEKLSINFENLVYSSDQSQDIILKPGDYLYVASDERREVYVLGAIDGSQAILYDDRLTLMKALSYVGGWRMGGPYGSDMQNVLIIRGDLDCPETIRVDLCMLIHGEARDIYLQPGDIVYLHDKKFRYGRELVRLAVTTFIQSFVNSAAIQWATEHILITPTPNNP